MSALARSAGVSSTAASSETEDVCEVAEAGAEEVVLLGTPDQVDEEVEGRLGVEREGVRGAALGGILTESTSKSKSLT